MVVVFNVNHNKSKYRFLYKHIMLMHFIFLFLSFYEFNIRKNFFKFFNQDFSEKKSIRIL